MARVDGEREGRFIVTREHRRFVEFADAVRRHRYIGLCYGPAGVGKTLSARRYAGWHTAEEMLAAWGPREPWEAKARAALNRTRSVFYTPTVGGTLRELREQLPRLIARVDINVGEHLQPPGEVMVISRDSHKFVQLVIIDEAERLSNTALEWIRDLFDRRGVGLILIGMPGIEKRLSRYPQLYSRVGFAHQYRPLGDEELSFVLTRRWRELGLELDEADFTDAQAVASVVRITGGNFRLVQRLFVQIERILKINGLSAITDDVVEAARSTLVIGAT
mgnify:FL=1|jgi:DNA transposition AAA+ family ATPase